MNLLMDILEVGLYSLMGVILMLAGNFFIDLIVPCHFPTEIKKDNRAVGWVCAGSYIAIGTIMKAAVMSPTISKVEEKLLEGVTSSALYFVVGVIFLIVGYLVVLLFNKKYNLNEEIGKGNASAGIMIFGIFVGLAMIISGVIM